MEDRSECCGCCTYKTGITVLAIFSLIGSLFRIVFGSLILPQCTNDSCNASGIVYIIGGVVVLIAAILLLVGLYQNKTNLLIPYIVLMFMNAISCSILGVVVMVNGLIFNGIYLLFVSSLDYYFAYCVMTYRRKIIAQNLIRGGHGVAPPTGVNLGYNVGVAPVYPATGYQGTVIQTAYPGAGIQSGYPGAGYQSGYPGAGNQPGYPGAGIQSGYPGAGNQSGYPGAGNQSGYPGAVGPTAQEGYGLPPKYSPNP